MGIIDKLFPCGCWIRFAICGGTTFGDQGEAAGHQLFKNENCKVEDVIHEEEAFNETRQYSALQLLKLKDWGYYDDDTKILEKD